MNAHALYSQGRILTGILTLVLSLLPQLSTFAQSTAFTYQGRLDHGGAPANGIYDLRFAIYDAAAAGAQQGNALTNAATTVSNGLFTVLLNFGYNVFPGADRWLEIAVRESGSGVFTPLTPRQPVTSVPYAQRAAQATTYSGTVAATQITGTLAPNNIAGGSITANMLAPGAAMQSILGSGTATVPPGGVVMSDTPSSPSLLAQGFVRLPDAQLSLVAENWTRKKNPVNPPEFIAPEYWETSVNTGTEFIVFRVGAGSSGRIDSVLRLNLGTGQWSKGSNPPAGNMSLPPVGGARYCTAVWTGNQVLLWGGGGHLVGSNPIKVYAYSPGTDQWTVIDGTGDIPQGRSGHTAVWTGSRMLVWGGERYFTSSGLDYYEDVNTGGSFNPVTGAWTAISTVGSPAKRRNHVAVWTGSRMIVHGGVMENRGTWAVNPAPDSPTNVFSDGFSYNPATDTWSPIRSDSSAPRLTHASAVWTGSEMFVYAGGYWQYHVPSLDYVLVPELAAYSYRPSLDVWTWRGAPDAAQDPVKGHLGGGLAFTGSEVLAYGGTGYNTNLNGFPARNDGVAYNLAGNSWRKLPAAPAGMPPVIWPCVIWSTNRMIVFGGYQGSLLGTSTNGAAFSPGANAWTTLPSYFGAPPFILDAPAAVWTGTEFILWGGPLTGQLSNRGQRYNPATDTWTEMTTVNAPAARQGHTAVWTGSRMIVWGGDNGSAVYANGGVYNPATDTWESYTSLNNPPVDPVTGIAFKRTGHKAVWTVHGMIVVGGSDGDNGGNQIYNPTFARYNFPNDDWDLAAAGYPLGRWRHSLATDGTSQVFLWGGYTQIDSDPVGQPVTIDAASLVATPRDAADQHTPAADSSSVWTGKEFIVWGGTALDGSPLEGGARFDPALELWTPVYVSSTPHAGHTAAWSGTEMLLWGGTTKAFGTRYNPRNNSWTPMSVGPVVRSNALSAWTGNRLLLYLPALAAPGAVPELWSYTPPITMFYYLKQ